MNKKISINYSDLKALYCDFGIEKILNDMDSSLSKTYSINQDDPDKQMDDLLSMEMLMYFSGPLLIEKNNQKKLKRKEQRKKRGSKKKDISEEKEVCIKDGKEKNEKENNLRQEKSKKRKKTTKKCKSKLANPEIEKNPTYKKYVKMDLNNKTIAEILEIGCKQFYPVILIKQLKECSLFNFLNITKEIFSKKDAEKRLKSKEGITIDRMKVYKRDVWKCSEGHVEIEEEIREKCVHDESVKVINCNTSGNMPTNFRAPLTAVLYKLGLPRKYIGGMINRNEKEKISYIKSYPHTIESEKIIQAGATFERVLIERLYIQDMCIYVRMNKGANVYMKIDMSDSAEGERIWIVDSEEKEIELDIAHNKYYSESGDEKSCIKNNPKMVQKIEKIQNMRPEEYREFRKYKNENW